MQGCRWQGHNIPGRWWESERNPGWSKFQWSPFRTAVPGMQTSLRVVCCSQGTWRTLRPVNQFRGMGLKDRRTHILLTLEKGYQLSFSNLWRWQILDFMSVRKRFTEPRITVISAVSKNPGSQWHRITACNGQWGSWPPVWQLSLSSKRSFRNRTSRLT